MTTTKEKEIVELPIGHLKVGMYVSQLDRPWIETPFLFQGFEVGEEELTELRKLCKMVYVEVTAAEAVELNAQLARVSKPKAEEPPKRTYSNAVFDELAANPSARRGLVPAKDSVPLKTELVAAKEAHGAAKKAVSNMVDHLRRGRGLDVPHMESVVDPMVDSVMRNRDAVSWLASMRTKDDYIYSHSLATSVWALAFGRHLGLDKDTLKAVGLGAMLMDIGKTLLPNELLNKVNPTEEELKTLRGHVERGLEVVRAAPGMDERVVTMIVTQLTTNGSTARGIRRKSRAMPSR